MADVFESNTGAGVEKGQPNYGVRRQRAKGLRGEEEMLYNGRFPGSAGVPRTLTRKTVGVGKGRAE